jgi:hypothetical protein
MNQPPSQRPTGEPQATPPASFLRVMGVVLSSFLGIRKRAQSDRDAGSIKPIHVIAAGVLAAAIFVGILIAAVRLITRSL